VDELDEHDLAGTAPYDDAFLDARRDELLEWRKRINLQYEGWEGDLAQGKVTTAPPRIANSLRARFGDSIELVGYDVFPMKLKAGQDLHITYVFKCNAAVPSTTKLFVHIDRGRGHLNADHEPVGGTYPPGKWKPGEYIVDDHVVHIPGDWEEPKAKICVGFWDKKTKARLPVTGDGTVVDEDRLVVTEVPVERRRTSAPAMTEEEIREKISDCVGAVEPPFGERVGVVFGDTVELVGVTLTRTGVKLAGTVEMTYVFKALKEVPPGWKLTVRLERADGGTVKGDHVPIGGLYPLSMWRPGEYVVDRHKIHIDMYKTKVGDYAAWLGFTHNGRAVPAAGEAEIDASGRVRLADVRIDPKTERQ